jgi:hypothetical protein
MYVMIGSFVQKEYAQTKPTTEVSRKYYLLVLFPSHGGFQVGENWLIGGGRVLGNS